MQPVVCVQKTEISGQEEAFGVERGCVFVVVLVVTAGDVAAQLDLADFTHRQGLPAFRVGDDQFHIIQGFAHAARPHLQG